VGRTQTILALGWVEAPQAGPKNLCLFHEIGASSQVECRAHGAYMHTMEGACIQLDTGVFSFVVVFKVCIR
jgi:hypothetical protein